MEAESSRYNSLESNKTLTLQRLREITNDFSDELLIGEGGFGKVYKGVLLNGSVVAVKKLNCTMPGIQDKHFDNEVHHLMRLKHPNVVRLVGYCSETEHVHVKHNGRYVYAEKSERLLCLEYMPRGSLLGHISDESSGLDWGTRYEIIEGICNGLLYFHEEWQVTPIIHMDLKPANILLDDNMAPKIADFGLSKLFGEEQTRTCTKNCRGTLGYMAPEYLNKGIVTKKLDIFSLGVIIIEIMTGHKDYPDEDNTSSQEFIEQVLKNWKNRLEKTPGYISLEAFYQYQQISMCIQIGLLCVKLNRAERPTIRQIIDTFRTATKEAWMTEEETVGTSAKEANDGEGQAKKKSDIGAKTAGEAETTDGEGQAKKKSDEGKLKNAGEAETADDEGQAEKKSDKGKLKNAGEAGKLKNASEAETTDGEGQIAGGETETTSVVPVERPLSAPPPPPPQGAPEPVPSNNVTQRRASVSSRRTPQQQPTYYSVQEQQQRPQLPAYYVVAQEGTYLHMFDDENPNACSVM